MSGFPLLAFLPASAFLMAVAVLVGGGCRRPYGARLSFVLTAVAWGAYLTLSTEFLSAVRGLSAGWIVIVWSLPSVGLGVWGWRTGSFVAAWEYGRERIRGLSRAEWFLVGSFVLLCGVLLGVALVSPPNTYDSGLYHMARVVHWAQNASLAPYPVRFEHQLHKPIWAETAILHLRLLWGSDRPAGLVQWFSMVGSLIVVSGIVAQLRGHRGAQFVAAAYAISIPMGVLQATSTQNDYVAAFWVVAVAYLVVLSLRRDLTRWELLALAASVGIGALSKGTFFVYGPPLVAWFLISRLRTAGAWKAVRDGLVIGGVAILLNAGFWARNIEVYGGPYGTSEWLRQNLWEPTARDTTPSGEVPSTAAEAQRSYLVRLAMTAGRNLTLPTGLLNRPVMAFLRSVTGVFGEAYAAEMESVAWNHEDSAGNPLHLLLVPVAGLVLLFARGRPWRRAALAYTAVSLIAFGMIPVVIGHGPSIYGIRYQLSFFVLFAPAAGLAAEAVFKPEAWRWLAAGLMALSLPWVLLNRTRPLVGMFPERTMSESILVEPQENLLVAWNAGLRDDYAMAAEAVARSGCRQVELRAYASFPEYPFWWLLAAPQSGVRIENLDVAVYLRRYIDPDFEPCAIICANCDEQPTAGGLPLYGVYDSMRVYLERSVAP